MILFNIINAILPKRWRLIEVAAPLSEAPRVDPPQLPGVRPADFGNRYFYLGPDVALVRLQDGHMLFVDPQDESVSTHLIANGYWESWIHKIVLGLIAPGDRVIEVGANVGYYTVAMAARVGPTGSLVTLEANPKLTRLIDRSIHFNGYRPRTTIIGKAALDRPGRISFVTSRISSGEGHTQIPDTTLIHDRTIVDVETVRLDDLGVDEVDFIRMDAEGSEPLILRGAERLLSNPNITVCMEWSPIQMGPRASVPDLVSWLTAQQFRFWRIEGDSSLTLMEPDDMVTAEHCDVVMSRKTPTAQLAQA